MLSLAPAFVGGLPGGVELLIVFFIAFLLFGVPLALAVLLGYRYVTGHHQTAETDQRIDDLESELETLREQVDGTLGKDSADAATADTADASSTTETADSHSRGGTDE